MTAKEHGRELCAMAARPQDHLETIEPTPWADLSDKERISAELFVSGRSIAEIAEALKVNRTTVWRWSKKDDFVEYASWLRQQRRMAAMDLLQQTLRDSLSAVGHAARDGDTKIALGYVAVCLKLGDGIPRLWPVH